MKKLLVLLISTFFLLMLNPALAIEDEVKLICSSDNYYSGNANQSTPAGMTYIFYIKGNKIYNDEHKQIKRAKVTDSTIKFTFKNWQSFTREVVRFKIDRYSGTFRAYRTLNTAWVDMVSDDSGVCKISETTKKRF